MGIYLGDKQGIAYKGDYKPVSIYYGSKKATGWELSQKTGTELSWDDTYNDKVLSAVVEGKSEQAVTVQGKNLFDKNKRVQGLTLDSLGNTITSSLSDVSDYIKVNASTAYTISGFNNAIARIICFYDINKACISYISGTNLTITTLSNCAYIRATLAKTDVDTYQLELGSTATAYAPFTPNSPSPDYPSPIISAQPVVESRGRNLLPNAATSQTSNGVIFTVNADKSITINGIKTNSRASSFAVLSGNFYQYQNKIINFSLDNDYVYSGGAVGVNIGARFTDGRFVPIVLGGQLRAKSFWCNNDIGCIYIEAVKSDLYNNLEVLPQLTLGTTPHPYIPYRPPSSIMLPPLQGGDDYQDTLTYIGNGYWEYKAYKPIIVLHGGAGQEWSKDGDFYNITTPIGAGHRTSMPYWRCTRAQYEIKSMSNTTEKFYFTHSSLGYFEVSKYIYPTVADLRAQLAAWYDEGDPMILEYTNANPTPEILQLGTLASFPRYTHVEQITDGVRASMQLTAKVVDR